MPPNVPCEPNLTQPLRLTSSPAPAVPAVPAAAEISPKHGLLTGIYDTIGMVNSGELSK